MSMGSGKKLPLIIGASLEWRQADAKKPSERHKVVKMRWHKSCFLIKN
ncbi:hypothetical protein EBB_13800 [Methylomonas sp. EbB]|uniref:Uncharacterized protein n=1 Tax=Methylomonas fluvii TaxID=1854564 RepID=A0ABR9DEP9_9GAMM|nr:hypothetical protein [Methylomonas fluvii]MBD9361579.1 hypothetical protein [Methylomonas fluvii]